MQIRFIEAPVPSTAEKTFLKESEGVCNACGFRATSGLRCYTEEDGVATVACGVCFTFRHAKDFDLDLYTVGWIPEVTQTDLAHLMRVIAVILMRHPVTPERGNPELSEATKLAAKSIVSILRGRASVLLESAVSLTDNGKVCSLVEQIPPSVRDKLLDGLRIMPIAFEKNKVVNWLNDESSLNGYGTELLNEQKWFIEDLGIPNSFKVVPLTVTKDIRRLASDIFSRPSTIDSHYMSEDLDSESEAI